MAINAESILRLLGALSDGPFESGAGPMIIGSVVKCDDDTLGTVVGHASGGIHVIVWPAVRGGKPKIRRASNMKQLKFPQPDFSYPCLEGRVTVGDRVRLAYGIETEIGPLSGDLIGIVKAVDDSSLPVQVAVGEKSFWYPLHALERVMPEDARGRVLHCGEWRQKERCSRWCSVATQVNGTLCRHPGGIVPQDHWSCCGETNHDSSCRGPMTIPDDTTNSSSVSGLAIVRPKGGDNSLGLVIATHGGVASVWSTKLVASKIIEETLATNLEVVTKAPENKGKPPAPGMTYLTVNLPGTVQVGDKVRLAQEGDLHEAFPLGKEKHGVVVAVDDTLLPYKIGVNGRTSWYPAFAVERVPRAGVTGVAGHPGEWRDKALIYRSCSTTTCINGALCKHESVVRAGQSHWSCCGVTVFDSVCSNTSGIPHDGALTVEDPAQPVSIVRSVSAESPIKQGDIVRIARPDVCFGCLRVGEEGTVLEVFPQAVNPVAVIGPTRVLHCYAFSDLQVAQTCLPSRPSAPRSGAGATPDVANYTEDPEITSNTKT